MVSVVLLVGGCGGDDAGTNPDNPTVPVVTDIDGNVYQTVTIGAQVWMAENLKVTHYRNGDPIPNVTDTAAWEGLSTGAYCEYDNDINNVATYGRLYNWYAVDDSRGLAPEGWHVPSDDEWKQLEMYLGMSQSEADDYGWRGTDEGGEVKGNRHNALGQPQHRRNQREWLFRVAWRLPQQRWLLLPYG
jgi:uncharacterized protein (TIGR02145 family)